MGQHLFEVKLLNGGVELFNNLSSRSDNGLSAQILDGQENDDVSIQEDLSQLHEEV